MKIIPLTRGFEAMVDDEDFDWLSQRKWFAHPGRNTIYAARTEWINGKRSTIFMHREILKPVGGKLTDHVNRNGLDNRRSNLRECTYTQNAHNRKVMTNNTHGTKGLYWDKHRNQWRVSIQDHGKRRLIGTYPTKEQAALARTSSEITMCGEFRLCS